MKIPRKCYNHEGQPSRGTKRRHQKKERWGTQKRDKKKMPHMKPHTNKQRRVSRKTTSMEVAGVGVEGGVVETSSLSPDASPNIKRKQSEAAQSDNFYIFYNVQ